MSNSNVRTAYGNLRQNETGEHDFINPTTIRKEWDNPEYKIDGMFQSKSPATSSLGTEDPAESDLLRETIENLSTSRNLPVTQLRTPLKAPLKRPNISTPEENTATSCDQLVGLIMVEQSAAEFARSSLEEIEQLQLPIDSPETYKNLVSSLKTTRRVQATWSSGSEWKSMVESGFAERHKSSIRYALTAIAFARWHRGQADLPSPPSPTAAVQEVSSRILSPVPEDANEKKVREMRRKRLATHLTRGRIWDKLQKAAGRTQLLSGTLSRRRHCLLPRTRPVQVGTTDWYDIRTSTISEPVQSWASYQYDH
ncbi:hypothetical protein F5B18DRAFT_644390 [Nemania serpens]|nr:hypothetical protein F5B18DRAFT_644390 [Nemania serpens]